jgi:hypothetical protein
MNTFEIMNFTDEAEWCKTGRIYDGRVVSTDIVHSNKELALFVPSNRGKKKFFSFAGLHLANRKNRTILICAQSRQRARPTPTKRSITPSFGKIVAT